VKEVDDYSWPSVDWFDFSHLKEEIARLNKDRRYAIMYFAGGSFESPWYMRGLERFLMDLIECPDIAEAICRHVTDFYKKRVIQVKKRGKKEKKKIKICGINGLLLRRYSKERKRKGLR